ncbi:MAG: low affinity iron permease family protein [Hyphomicrobiales bacterium]|nr:low affinity iron permease family protein [Hyphomicrobiales bacterium]
MNHIFARVASQVAQGSGRPLAFLAAALLIAIWALTGPLFQFSDTWQLVVNTGTTIVTFLMVFVIQNTQNRDGAAIQAKLDELIAQYRESCVALAAKVADRTRRRVEETVRSAVQEAR